MRRKENKMKVKIPKTTFQIYRYQILPISPNIQLNLFDESIKSVDDLKAKKNTFFWDVIKSMNEMSYPRGELNCIKDSEDSPALMISINCKRVIRIPEKDFTEKQFEMWPPVHIVFNNDPEIQKIAISVNPKAFQSTQTVASILRDNINERLSKLNLAVYIKPTYEESEFWAVVDAYPNNISQVRFELISPNMSNISESVKFDLHHLHKNTNTIQTNLELNSAEDSALQLNKSDEMVESLAQYASRGGGDISFKIHGLKKRIKTAKKITEVYFENAEITGNPEVVLDFFKRLPKL